MVTIVYRTDNTAAWGAGKGGDLTPAEVDQNFFNISEAIDALGTGPQPAEIDTIAVSGSQMTITLSDATVFGPYTLPTSSFRADVVVVTGATYTANSSYSWGYHRCTDAGGCTVTVPDDASDEFPVGSEIAFAQIGAAAVDFTASTVVTINVPAGYQAQTSHVGAVARLRKVAADEWDLYGDLAAV